jgi:glycyl-tRNA synthetase beta subunit
MIIHQQSIIDFNISSIEGSNTNNKNRFLDEGLITLTNQMKDFPNKLKYKDLKELNPILIILD